ncbi:hypothetical protein [Peloplasma aerotolerans]|uniref:Uncharacterized protein n=1 Tax=Peloplasma aerotolerans TaxID=3044389 RepID=A0AAW6U7Q7_9MOLU|nr:hypothetical protein [Mariniplasma sp. M4Ah]MDI6452810.1 hypothetical protein [Mariniplasma sp. M4Ah]
MKKIVYMILMVLSLFSLAACQESETNETYIPDVPNYQFEPSGDTSVVITEIESGSALLSFNELDRVSHYVVEVSKDIQFNKNSTVTIVALESQYRLFFDDHVTLYTRATAIAENGKTYGISEIQKIESKYAIYHTGDDFNLGTTTGWSVVNGKVESDFHSLIVQPTGEGTTEISKTFEINPEDADFFQIRFLTKNTHSKISVTLIHDDQSYPVAVDMEQIQRGYLRYDLSEMNLAGLSNVTVHIKSEGNNRGFHLDYVKFIQEEEHEFISPMIEREMSNIYNELLIQNNKLIIRNDSEPTVIATPSTEVEFDPNELPILEMILTDYQPRDTIKLTITNSLDEVVYETETLFIQNVNGKLSFNLFELGLIEKDMYTISYVLSSDRVVISSMQLVGESELSFDVVHGEWVDGFSAYIDQDNVIRLKETTIYNYGDIRKQVTVDLDQTPIVFFDVVSVTGAWAVKVIPDGASSDIYVARDNSKTGKVAYDISQILQAQGTTTFTFVVFVIGGFAADQSAALVMNPIRFGNALNIISNTSDEVISQVTYEVGDINLNDIGYIYIDVDKISSGAMWKLYVVNLENNRRYEMRTLLERKYPQRYFRSKEGRYIYDIKAITELEGIQNLGIMIEVIGNDGSVEINDILFTTNKNIPSKNNSSY